MKLSLVITVLNEEKSIAKFINSLLKQSVMPYELIIVDGGSTDNTVDTATKLTNKVTKLKVRILEKKGNRSIGRNFGIDRALGDIILLSDAGNTLDKDWVKNISSPFKDKGTDVVAGYYKGVSTNYFEKSLIPYALVMPDKVNSEDFLPATRSMAIKKSVWKNVGKFNETLSHNEDYEFANRLKGNKTKIIFSKNPIVYWSPRKNLKEAFVMFFRFALGDVQANIIREKVIYIFLRYFLAVYLFFIAIIFRSILFWSFYLLLLFGYIFWSIWKNYRYVNNVRAFIYLPLLQITSDIAVILASTIGFFQRFSISDLVKSIFRNRWLFLIILIYIISNLSVIGWGVPNNSHPFNYHMDEWHFAQALRTFIKYGSGSISGAASIPLFHIVSTLVFLVPFFLLGIVNPLAIKSSVTNLDIQSVFFEVLRLHTAFYGVLSILVLYLILKKYVRFKPSVFTAIFASTPIWIFLSNFYKYDITLNFWIILVIYFILKFSKTKEIKNFYYSCIVCGLALSTKFTAAPLLLGISLSYFLYAGNRRWKELLSGIFLSLIIFSLVGIPDLIFGKGNYYQLLYSTLIQGPQASSVYNLGVPAWVFLATREYPSIFGAGLLILTYFSFFYWTVVIAKSFLKKRLSIYKDQINIYLIFVLFFTISLLFNLDGGGNRALVLLPFMILISAYTLKEIFMKYKIKNLIYVILVFILFLQIAASASWSSIKFEKDMRNVSSDWIINNIKRGSEIGLENIPIYQAIPNFILKDFYLKQYGKIQNSRYKYLIVSSQTKNLPNTVIITQDYNNLDYINTSAKKSLVKRLLDEKYKRVIVFSPNLSYYDLFADRMTYILIYPMPLTISVYEK